MIDDPGTNLKRSADYDRLNSLEAQVYEIQLTQLRKDSDDHERRIRSLEETATKINFLLYLTMGGGFVSLINLAGMAFVIVTYTTGSK